MDKIFDDYIRDVSLVSISGTDDVINFNPKKGDWSDAIRPLDEGDKYVTPFLMLLKQHNYQGPILLHTFGIRDNPKHLQRSLKHFRAIMAERKQSRWPQRTTHWTVRRAAAREWKRSTMCIDAAHNETEWIYSPEPERRLNSHT